jgi:hypothetical protein
MRARGYLNLAVALLLAGGSSLRGQCPQCIPPGDPSITMNQMSPYFPAWERWQGVNGVTAPSYPAPNPYYACPAFPNSYPAITPWNTSMEQIGFQCFPRGVTDGQISYECRAVPWNTSPIAGYQYPGVRASISEYSQREEPRSFRLRFLFR